MVMSKMLYYLISKIALLSSSFYLSILDPPILVLKLVEINTALVQTKPENIIPN